MAATINGSRLDGAVSHVSESNVEPFLQGDFDPADYLNNALPSLSTSSRSRPTQQDRSVPLPELSAQLQSLLPQLNAQMLRMSTALTQLTDEIIRSGGRLAYEVELLRGETLGLKDSLEGTLKNDIDAFVRSSITSGLNGQPESTANGDTAESKKDAESETLEQLKTLTSVRARLDSVIKVFGEAMEWPIAPSDLSAGSSIISVTAPGVGEDFQGRETKGKAYAEKLRNEVNELAGSGKDSASIEAANARIDELRQLAQVWKGTSEEKARLKQVEILQKIVDDKQKSTEKVSGSRRPTPSPARGMDYRYGGGDTSRSTADGGYGFLSNLRTVI